MRDVVDQLAGHVLELEGGDGGGDLVADVGRGGLDVGHRALGVLVDAMEFTHHRIDLALGGQSRRDVLTGHGLHDPAGLVDRGVGTVDERADFFGEAMTVGGEFADLVGDDHEAAAGIPGARGLDVGVEGEKTRALGDVLDLADPTDHLVHLFADLLDAPDHVLALARDAGDLLDEGTHEPIVLGGELVDGHAVRSVLIGVAHEAAHLLQLHLRALVHSREARSEAADGVADQAADLVDFLLQQRDLFDLRAHQFPHQHEGRGREVFAILLVGLDSGRAVDLLDHGAGATAEEDEPRRHDTDQTHGPCGHPGQTADSGEEGGGDPRGARTRQSESGRERESLGSRRGIDTSALDELEGGRHARGRTVKEAGQGAARSNDEVVSSAVVGSTFGSMSSSPSDQNSSTAPPTGLRSMVLQ